MENSKNYLVLVVGGGGYVGKLLVKRLLEKGYSRVRVLDCYMPSDTSFLLCDERVEYIKGDLTDISCMNNACKNVRRVFHLATPSYLVTNKTLLYKVNVEGTKTIINACIEQNVNELIYCSSASVVFGSKPIILGDESLPYIKEGEADAYNVTKALAEQLVLNAHGTLLKTEEGKEEKKILKTLALRPHSIFGCNGEGGTGIIDPMLDAIKRGKGKVKIGNGENLSDFTHVENVVYAHILAGEKLEEEKEEKIKKKEEIGGKAYNITNDEPMKFWNFLSDVAYYCGYNRPYINLPYMLLMVIAFISELMCGKNITFTVQKVRLLGLHHTYSIERAKCLLGYTPVISFDEGFRQTIDFIKKNDKIVQEKLRERESKNTK